MNKLTKIIGIFLLLSIDTILKGMAEDRGCDSCFLCEFIKKNEKAKENQFYKDVYLSCQSCLSYKAIGDFRKHMLAEHINEQISICTLCSLGIENSIEQHIQEHFDNYKKIIEFFE